VGTQTVYSFWGMDGNQYVNLPCLAEAMFEAASAEGPTSTDRMFEIAAAIECVALRSSEEDKVNLMEMMSTIDEYLRAVR